MNFIGSRTRHNSRGVSLVEERSGRAGDSGAWRAERENAAQGLSWARWSGLNPLLDLGHGVEDSDIFGWAALHLVHARRVGLHSITGDKRAPGIEVEWVGCIGEGDGFGGGDLDLLDRAQIDHLGEAGVKAGILS